MQLQIDVNTKIIDVQKKFSKSFPFLKLEFYKRKYAEKKVSLLKDRISTDKLISEVAKSFQPGSIEIHPNNTVAAIEKEFFEKFGIAMQVSRKSGKIWIETSKTDDRTLKAQNLLGKMSAMPVGVERERMDVD